MNNTGAKIMTRLINGSLSAELAECILSWDFPKKDHRRMAKLQAKASEGTLTAKDRVQLEQYLGAADLLAILQSKARRTLKRGKAGPSIPPPAPQMA